MTEAPDPIELAARALQHRDRSRRELDERLERAGIAAETRARALETLERVGYVDDDRFAIGRAESLASRGYGDEAIRERLAVDGVEPAAIGAAIAALELERVRAARIVARRGASARTAARLQRMGFGEDAVEAAGCGFAEDGPEA